MRSISNGAEITRLDTGESWHTLRDWGLAMERGSVIGLPVVETHYVRVPGRPGLLDYAEVLTGAPVYTERPITMTLGGRRQDWPEFLHELTHKLHGRRVRLVFDDLRGYYWEGRAELSDFDRLRQLGHFTLALPHADPYGCAVAETEVNLSVDDEAAVLVKAGPAPFHVGVRVLDIPASGQLRVDVPGQRYGLAVGENTGFRPFVTEEDLTLNFVGSGTVCVHWREGIL